MLQIFKFQLNISVDRTVNFTSTISPVCLPSDLSETFERELGVVAGWGITGKRRPIM